MRQRLLACLIVLGSSPAAAQATGDLTGVVRSAAGAVAGAIIAVRDGPSSTALSDSAGRFALHRLPAGPCSLSVTKEGFTPSTIAVTVRAGETTHVTVTLVHVAALATVTVAATPGGSYAAPNSVGATKFPVPSLDLPQDVAVVTRAVIDDRAITDMRDLTKNVSGVTLSASFNGVGHNEVNFVFRGTPSDAYANNSLRDGFREYALIAPRDMASVDHVEFLKGPASVLYGAEGAFGGIANFVSKAPLARPAGEAELIGDSFGALRATLDLGGPVASWGTLQYRLDLAAERSNSFRDFSDGRGLSGALALGWTTGPSTSMTLRAEFTQRRFRGDPMLPVDYAGVMGLPISRYLSEPAFAPDRASGIVTAFTLSNRFGNGWTVREALSYVQGRVTDRGTAFWGLDSADPSIMHRLYGVSGDGSTNAASQTELISDIGAGAVRHRVVFGLELSGEWVYHWDWGDSLAPISLTNPVYGAIPANAGVVGGLKSATAQAGLYAQDLIDLGDKWKLLLGARFDASRTNVTVGGESYFVDFVGASHQSGHHLSPKAGVVFQPTTSTSLYGVWSTSYLPNLSTPSHGDAAAFPPEIGEQFELGVKQEWAGGRFAATLAAYQLVRRNVLMGDTTDTHFPPRSLPTWLDESRGVEIDASGSPAPGLGLVIAYAFTQEMVNPRETVNWTAPNLPRHRGSFWARYSVQRGLLTGAGFGAGVTAATFQYQDYGRVNRLPAYALIDAMLGYRFTSFTVQVNGYNLGDARTYVSIPYVALEPGAPRSFRTTIAYRW